MAILIPSRNIYAPINNDKILKNVKERIEVNATEVVPSNEYDIPIFNFETTNITYSKKSEISSIDGITNLITGSNVSYEQGAYIKITPYISTLSLKIPKLLKNKYVSELILGKDKSGNFNVSISISYEVQRGVSLANFSHDTLTDKASIEFLTNGQSTSTTETKTLKEFAEYDLTEAFGDVSASVFNEFNNTYSNEAYGILGDKQYVETDDYFSFDISFLSGYEKLTYSGESPANPSQWWQIQGIYEKYIPQKFAITVYGNTIGIDFQNKLITISEQGKENSKKVFSVDNNELLQTSNYVSGTNANAIEENYKNTLNAYKNGRETATLLCDIGEYKYYEEDMLAISTKEEGYPMTFNVGDEVIPMVYGANGEDFPMSQKDGVPKVFVVSSVKPYYDGAVWQQIEIQEKTS